MGRHSDVSIKSGREHGAMIEYDSRLALIDVLPGDVDRFWEKVDVRGPDECWEWRAASLSGGYGSFGYGGGGKIRARGAHRFSFAIHNLFHSTKLIRHDCDNPPCVNPAHLREGSVADNSADMVSRGRSLHGERHHKAILNDELVLSIRARFRAGESTLSISEEIGISRATVYQAVTRRSWRHLP